MKDARSAESRHGSMHGRPDRWDFFWLLVRRDLKVRYAGSALGALWNLIHPIVMIVVYIVIFSSLMTSRGDRATGAEGGAALYVLHLCSGILVWLVFAEVLNRSVTTLVDNRNFLQKVSFPPLLLHASIFFNVLIVHLGGLLAFRLLLLATDARPPFTWVATAGIMALVGLAASGLGMILSAAHVFFRDTAQVALVALQVGFWFNPIVYTKRILGEPGAGGLRRWISLNPIEHFVSTAQSWFGSPWGEPSRIAPVVIVVFPALCLAIGLIVFKRLLPEVRDGL